MKLASNESLGSSNEGTLFDQNAPAGKPRTQGGLASLSETALHETAPSEATRKALGVAAEVIIKQSKKVLDMAVRVTAHQPLNLSWDAIVDPADIRQVLEAVGDAPAYPRSQLVLMASNSLETLPLAREYRKRFIDKLTREASPPNSGSDAWILAAPDSPLNQLMTILSKIEQGALEEAERMISKAVDNDPSFNHPVAAEFMCSRLSDRNEDRQLLQAWLRRALYFRPLDLRIIETLIAVEDQHNRKLLKQLAAIASGSDGVSQ